MKKKLVAIKYCNFCLYKITASIGGTICDKVEKELHDEDGIFFIPKWCPLPEASELGNIARKILRLMELNESYT